MYCALAISNLHSKRITLPLCSGILIETANHFVNNNSCVYSCFLDASKAFDKVHYRKLFNLMLKSNVPSVIVRFILDGYIRQCMLHSGNVTNLEFFMYATA